MAVAMRRADLVRQESDRVGARERADHYHLLAQQRRFELAIDAEVKASVERIFDTLCKEAIAEAVQANRHSVVIDIQTSYMDEPEPIPREYWWKAGTRCKAICRHLQAYLRNEGFEVHEGEQYHTRTYRGAVRGNGMHAVPLTVSW